MFRTISMKRVTLEARPRGQGKIEARLEVLEENLLAKLAEL